MGGGGGGVVGKAENIATQPSLAGAWAELGNTESKTLNLDKRNFHFFNSSLMSFWSLTLET